eukprot:gnl/TRDRNA2_/TRDRNA2_74440_c0_seq1.p1 gnl/TRDRNA2_/TRDRNA2_74440_c0~~gnl/TRDRNA2_/TRDRNA2_74440_c0_seq1.p1  ORF type:complete len:298 (+),score=45.72 gnl/TRDRNA2_/TRDRNA2_74440_c0_seq1:172-1065(+)
MDSSNLNGSGGKKKEIGIYHKLTFVPEEAKPISHRFTATLVGKGTAAFAEWICHSEHAEACKPKRASREQNFANLRMSDNGREHVEGEREDFMQVVSDTKGGCPLAGDRLHKDGHLDHHDGEGDEEHNKFVLFLHIGEDDLLVRLRLVPIESFSVSLPPPPKDSLSASNHAVVFIFWRVAAEGSEERINDLRMRNAEMMHMPKKNRPYASVIAFCLESSERDMIETWGPCKEGTVAQDFYDADDEETCITALEQLCAKLISLSKRGKSTRYFSTPSQLQLRMPKNGAGITSRACSIL